MPKKWLIVNKPLTGVSQNARAQEWEINYDEKRGHPMVSRKPFPPTIMPPFDDRGDYFRRCMARYYGWRDMSQWWNALPNFGMLLGNEYELDKQASSWLSVAINLSNYDDWISNSIVINDSLYSSIIDNLNGPLGPSVMSSLFGSPESGESNYGFGVETSFVIIEADLEQWLLSSDYRGISGWARDLTSPLPNGELGWYNWQAYVLGDQAIDFDVPKRKFPGIFGAGMVDTNFYDHAFERHVPDRLIARSNFNYYNSFFDTLKDNPNVLETHVPNYYAVSSVLYGLNGYYYAPEGGAPENLYYDPQAPAPALHLSTDSINNIKDILSATMSDTTDPNNPNIVDVVSPTDNITIGQVPVSHQIPNSLLSRFARYDFSSTDNTTALQRTRQINRHIGIPRKMLLGGQQSIVKAMDSHRQLFPYSVVVDLEDSIGSASELITGFSFDGAGTPTAEGQTLSNFFLYEIMKANILNFTSATGYPAAEERVYEELEVAARLTSLNAPIYVPMGAAELPDYYGFNSPALSRPALAANTEASEPYSLRVIDLKNLFRNIFKYSLDESKPTGLYAETDSAGTPYPESYSGFIGQSESENVVAGTGLIIGERFNTSAVPSTTTSGMEMTSLIDESIALNEMGDYSDFLDLFIRISDFLNTKVRNFGEMMTGALCYRDTLVYKLDKHSVNAEGQISEDALQSIYFANTGDAHKYVDTQVFSGKKYIYKFYAYDLVVGNEYKYTSPHVFPPIELPYPNPLASYLGSTTNIGTGLIWITPAIAFDSDPSHLALYWPRNDIGQGASTGHTIYVDLIIDGKHESSAVSLPGFPAGWDGAPVNVVLKYASAFRQNLESKINEMIVQHIQEHHDATDSDFSRKKYFSKFRVALMEDPGFSGMLRMRLFVGQVKDIVADGYGSAGQLTVIDRIHGFTSGLTPASTLQIPNPSGLSSAQEPNAYQTYFNLNPVYTSYANSSACGALDVQIALRTGQHGLAPVIPWDDTDAGQANVTTMNYKSAKIIEVPLTETNVIQVTDLPPQYPDVKIFPLKGFSQRIKILLSSNFTKATYVPIVIEPTDAPIFENVRIAQGEPADSPILFGSDDLRTNYQIFRTTEKPSTYQDFAGMLHVEKAGQTPEGKRVESVSIIDNISPNTYYYYCFRTVDKNGYISNPTPILRVQMVDDNGRIYPIIEPYNFDLSEPRKTEKSFKRYLEIDASLQEKVVVGTNTDSAGTPSAAPTGVSMGTAEGTFGSTTEYKVRIISKDTGRKIDLNLNFNVETIPNPNLPGN